MSEPARKSSRRSQLFFQFLANVCLDGFVYTFVRILRDASHIFLHVQVTLTKGVRLKSQHPAMFRLSTLGDLRASRSCVTRSNTLPPA
jgi:hypothetical protein